MARYKDRGESPKKRAKKERKRRAERAQDAEYDCRLEEGPPDTTRIVIRSGPFAGMYYQSDEDEAD